jgi:hypothetical protein
MYRFYCKYSPNEFFTSKASTNQSANIPLFLLKYKNPSTVCQEEIAKATTFREVSYAIEPGVSIDTTIELSS